MDAAERYVLKALKRGFTYDQINQSLLGEGHSQHHINEYFISIIKKLSIRNKIVYAASFLAFSIIIASFAYLIQTTGIDSDVPAFPLDADFLCREGNYEESVGRFNGYLLQNEPDPDVYFYLGLCHFKNEETEDAILSFSKALELDPDNPYAYYKLAQAQCKKQDFDLAEKNFDKAMELDPKETLFPATKQRCMGKKAGIVQNELQK